MGVLTNSLETFLPRISGTFLIISATFFYFCRLLRLNPDDLSPNSPPGATLGVYRGSNDEPWAPPPPLATRDLDSSSSDAHGGTRDATHAGTLSATTAANGIFAASISPYPISLFHWFRLVLGLLVQNIHRIALTQSINTFWLHKDWNWYFNNQIINLQLSFFSVGKPKRSPMYEGSSNQPAGAINMGGIVTTSAANAGRARSALNDLYPLIASRHGT